MKIEIDTQDCSYQAKVTVDGKEMVYGFKDGSWAYLSGLGTKDQNFTIGGIVATELASKIIDILQGYMPDEENPKTNACYETWDELPEHVAADIQERVGGW